MAHGSRARVAGAILLVLAAAPLTAQLVPLGPEFRINAEQVVPERGPVLALGDSGALLAVWTSPGVINSNILARSFNRAGEPSAPEVPISGVSGMDAQPMAVALASGKFVVGWTNTASPVLPAPLPVADAQVGDIGTISGRILDTAGTPVSEELRIDSRKESPYSEEVRLAPLPGGGFLATWENYVSPGGITWRRFDAEGLPTTDAVGIQWAYGDNLAVRALDDGSFVALWLTSSGAYYPYPPPKIEGRRCTAEGQPLAFFLQVEAGQVAIAANGHSVVAWSAAATSQAVDQDAYARIYGPDGKPLGPAIAAAGGPGDQIVEAVEIDEAGRFLVVWSNDSPQSAAVDSDVSARLFSAKGQPLGPAVVVSSETGGDQFGANVAEKDGEWAISWVHQAAGGTGAKVFAARRFATCVTDGPSLCLAGRFRVEVAWKTPGLGTGAGQAVPLTGDTGAFWFFSPDNLELVVKALDGRAINDHFWVFYGALSDVEYDLAITDVITGQRRVYHNPAGTMASQADVRAFAVPASASASFSEAVRTQAEPAASAPCLAGSEKLCLNADRFAVEVAWSVPATGATGHGTPVKLTADGGYFWFFDESNVELMVKVLDGRHVNGRHWVFYGALSDVEYTITVTDQETGKVRTYRNPAGTMASRADTLAF